MTAQMLERCKCGEGKLENGACPHCDQANPACTINIKHEECAVKQHDPNTCQRCKNINGWWPEPGDFPDLPRGYEDWTRGGR